MNWSPRTLLRALRRPGRVFADEVPPGGVAVAVLLVVAVANAIVTAQGAGTVADAITGTVPVDNPARPADWICREATSGDDFYEDYLDACRNQAPTVQEPLANFARDATGSLVALSAVAPAALAVALSGLVAVVSGGQAPDDPGERVRLAPVVVVTAVGSLPALLRYVTRWFAVEQSVTGRLTPSPGTADGVRSLTVDVLTPETTLYLAVVVATAAWSAAIWRAGWRAVIPGADRRVDAVAVAGGGFVVLAALRPFHPSGEAVAYGVLFFVLGVLPLAAPRVMERIDLWFDLIGTRGGEHVEVKPWRVYLEQGTGLLLVLAGAVGLGGLLFV
jgi:hypothetical protein